MKPCLLLSLLCLTHWATAQDPLTNFTVITNITPFKLEDRFIRYDPQLQTSSAGSHIELTLREAMAGRNPQEHYGFALTNSAWLDLRALRLGTGSVECIIDRTPINEPRRFYRIKRVLE